MKNAIRFKQISLFIGSLGFITSLFFCAYALGLFQMEELKEMENLRRGQSSVLGFSSYFPIYKDISLRLGLITISFFVFSLIIGFTQKTLFKIIGFLPLVVILVQSSILISLKPMKLPSLIGELKIESVVLFYYVDYLILALAVLLIILQILSIWKAKTVKDLSDLG